MPGVSSRVVALVVLLVVPAFADDASQTLRLADLPDADRLAALMTILAQIRHPLFQQASLA